MKPQAPSLQQPAAAGFLGSAHVGRDAAPLRFATDRVALRRRLLACIEQMLVCSMELLEVREALLDDLHADELSADNPWLRWTAPPRRPAPHAAVVAAPSGGSVEPGDTPAPGKRATPPRPAPAPRPETRPFRATAPPAAPVATFRRDQEAVTPPDVKRTVAVKPKGRFDVDEADVPSTFGPIGTYADTGSAIARAARGQP